MMARDLSWRLLLCLLLVLGTAMNVVSEEEEDDGLWLDYNQAEAELDSLPLLEPNPFTPADSMMLSEPDSTVGVNYGQFYLFEDIFLPPALEFDSWSLQDALRENLLGEEEEIRWTELFRADSSLALSLFQLREEEFPHYHLLSDLWVYIWRGRGELDVDGTIVEYGPGRFFQIPSGTLHFFKNISGAPTVGLVWARPALVDSLTVEIIPEEVLARLRADSLRTLDLQERSIYRQP